LNLIWDVNKRKEFDNHCMDFKKLRDLNDHTQLAHIKYSIPVPLFWPRDVVMVRTKRENYNSNGTCIVCSCSVEDTVLAAQEGFVRATIHASGFYIQPLTEDEKKEHGENACRMTFLLQVDPKGWIPPMVVNVVGPKGGIDSFYKMQAAANKQ